MEQNAVATKTNAMDWKFVDWWDLRPGAEQGCLQLEPKKKKIRASARELTCHGGKVKTWSSLSDSLGGSPPPAT